ncbi:hypothetical protein ACUH93_00705 [Dermabacteraceae bacterium P7006]
MARQRASARQAGTRMERMVADYLADVLEDDRIDRRVKTGAKDRGDIAGLRHLGQRVVVEVKDYGGRYTVGPWLDEAEVERGNDDAGVGVVVAKRARKGRPEDQVVFMTLRDFASLLSGARP